MSASATIWKSDTDDGRTRISTSRQSRTSVSFTGLAVEMMRMNGDCADGGKISRSYSYPLPSCAAPYHASLLFGYVHELPSAWSQACPARTSRPLADERRGASAGGPKGLGGIRRSYNFRVEC